MSGEELSEACDVCKESVTVPNKGLGRAVLAAWRTRHQHREEGQG